MAITWIKNKFLIKLKDFSLFINHDFRRIIIKLISKKFSLNSKQYGIISYKKGFMIRLNMSFKKIYFIINYKYQLTLI